MLRGVVAAFSFLTRIPVWRGPLLDADLGRSVGFFPLVGLVMGLALTGAAFGGLAVLPPLLLAALLLALLAGLSGGLHLDGLADLFDALGGGRGDRVRMLAIMRDSRIGAHGAAALTLLLIAKVAALARVLENRDLVVVLAFPAIARWAVTLPVVLFPYARPEGLGRAFNGVAGRRELAIAAVIAGAGVAALGLRLLAPTLAAGVLALAIGWWLTRRLGGLTGDIYGAVIEFAELTVLVAAEVN
jgi:adenosylcobinamide-GDP ribazoletransferase